MKRYFVKIGYHYWQIFDRQEGRKVGSSYRARDYGGDKPARDAVYARVAELNAHCRIPLSGANLRQSAPMATVPHGISTPMAQK